MQPVMKAVYQVGVICKKHLPKVGFDAATTHVCSQVYYHQTTVISCILSCLCAITLLILVSLCVPTAILFSPRQKIAVKNCKNCANFRKIALNFDGNCTKMAIFICYINNAKCLLEA